MGLADVNEKMESDSATASYSLHDKLEILLKVKEEPSDDANKSPECSQFEDGQQSREEFILPVQLSNISTEDIGEEEEEEIPKTKKIKHPKKTKDLPPSKVKYQCSVCKMEYSNKFHFQRHVHSRPCSGVPTPKHKCTICGKVYKRKDNLTVHLRSHTGEPPKYVRKMNHTCDHCGKQYHHVSALEIHVRKHTGEKPFPCDLCEKRFPSNGQLTLHLRKHTKEKPYACKECGARFGRRSSLKRHVLRRCNDGMSPYKSEEYMKRFGSKGRKNYNTSEHIFVCKECGEELKGKKALQNHVCNILFLQQSLKHNLTNLLEANVENSFNSDEKQADESKGTNENVLNDDSYPSASEHNEQGDGFSCKKCGQNFNLAESLQKHICTVLEPNSDLGDLESKPYQCTICLKRFAKKHILTVHVVTHTKEKPCSCDQCGRAFIRRDCLIRHLKRTRHKCEGILLI